MRRWLGLGMCLGLLMAPQIAYVADETCAAGVDHCSRQIAITDANSQVQFRFATSEVCVIHTAASANTVYVQFSSTAAQAAVDHSYPLTVARVRICIAAGRRTNQVNLIAASGLTAAVDVIALRE